MTTEKDPDTAVATGKGLMFTDPNTAAFYFELAAEEYERRGEISKAIETLSHAAAALDLDERPARIAEIRERMLRLASDAR
jgi:hypothetical protein